MRHSRKMRHIKLSPLISEMEKTVLPATTRMFHCNRAMASDGHALTRRLGLRTSVTVGRACRPGQEGRHTYRSGSDLRRRLLSSPEQELCSDVAAVENSFWEPVLNKAPRRPRVSPGLRFLSSSWLGGIGKLRLWLYAWLPQFPPAA